METAGQQGVDVVEHVREQARASGLFTRDRPVIAMLSGGRDSVCLLDVAIALRGAAQVGALHVNYGLRPQPTPRSAIVGSCAERSAWRWRSCTRATPERSVGRS